MSEKNIGIALLLAVLSFAGCHSVKTISLGNPERTSPVDYSVLIYIHGDGDYLFHERDGKAVQADIHALEKAIDTAKGAEHGEVFIFHHRSQKKILGLFPRNSSRAYHYRGGELLNEISYRLTSDQKAFLQTEADLFQNYRSENYQPDHRFFFLYFGHEIPDDPEQPYHLSRPETAVNIKSYTSGMKGFIDPSDRFSMVALSTCNSGTPAMMAHMEGIADVVVASPQNLHLSHLDIHSLSLLEADSNIPSAHIAGTIAEDTFQRLKDSIKTAITLSVYDVGKIGSYLAELKKHSEAQQSRQKPALFNDNTDCAQFPFFDSQNYTFGLESLFKPASFGSDTQKEEHSGWGCKPL